MHISALRSLPIFAPRQDVDPSPAASPSSSVTPALHRRSSDTPSAAKLQTYFFSSHEAATEVLNSRELGWLNERGNKIAIVPSDKIEDAMRVFAEKLLRAGYNVISLYRDSDYEELDPPQLQQNNPLLDQLSEAVKEALSKPGPLSKIRKDGGVLLVNMRKVRSAYVESDNNAMDQFAAGDRSVPQLSVILVGSMEDLDNGRLSDPLVSRTFSADMRRFAVPRFSLPVASDEELSTAHSIDLKGEDDWEERLFGGVRRDGEDLVVHTGELGLAPPGKPILLLNPPEDAPRLVDLVLKSQHRSQKLYFAEPPDDDTLLAGAADKLPADEIGTMLAEPRGQVYIVNMETITGLIKREIVITDAGKLADSERPPLLDREPPSGHMPVLYVTGSLTTAKWHCLMQYPRPFEIAAAPGVAVPEVYQDIVHVYEPDSPEIDEPLFSRPIAILKCLDKKMMEKIGFPDDVVRIHFEPTDGADKWISTMEPLPQAGRWQLKIQPLLQAMLDGKRIVVTGFENLGAAQTEFHAFLIGGYARLNDQCHPVGQHGGRLLILTGSDDLVNAFHSVPVHVDPVGNLERWQAGALNALKRTFKYTEEHAPGTLRLHLQQVLGFRELLERQQLISPTSPPINYQKLENLFRHTIDLPGFRRGQTLTELPVSQTPGLAQTFRNIFKDAMIGELPQQRLRSGTNALEDLRPYLKLCLRFHFPAYLERMPPRSVDVSRLANLLQRTHHENAILMDPWVYLACFSLDICERVIQTSGKPLHDKRGMEEAIGPVVLSVVVDTAKNYSVPLQARIENHAESWRTDALTRGQHLQNVPRVKTSPLWRNHEKAAVAVWKSNMLWLSDDTGTGRMDLGEKLRRGEPYDVQVARYGDDAFDQPIEAFLQSEGPATLIIEDVHRLDRHTLNRLQQAALNGSPDKRIIVTSTADPLQAQKLPEFVEHAMPFVRCKMNYPDIYKLFVAPIVDKLATLDPPVAEDVPAAIAETLFVLHAGMHETFTRQAFSPLHAAECAIQLVCVIQQKSLTTMDDIRPYINYIAQQVYTDALPEEDRHAAQLWLDRHHAFRPIPQEEIDALAPLPDDLETIGLADAPTARKLAQRLCWLVRTLEWRAALQLDGMGLPVTMLQGPPSIGKDTITPAVLSWMGRAHVTINANASNFDGFKNEIKDAIAQGKIPLASEPNVYTSEQLEELVNDLRASLGNGIGAFLLVNPPGTLGRNALLRGAASRMLCKQLPDYSEQDWEILVQYFAVRSKPALPPPFQQRAITREEIESVANIHIGLRKSLQAAGDPYLPGVRQLRNTFDLMMKGTSSVEQATGKAYAIYKMRAERAVAARREDKRADVRAPLRTCSTILRLCHQGRLGWRSYPRLEELDISDPTLHPVIGNPDRNVLHVDPSRKIEEVVDHLINVYGGRQLYSNDAQLVAILDSKLLVAARRKAEMDNADTPAPSMAPVAGTSLVGSAPAKGIVGHVTGAQSTPLYLVKSRNALDGSLLTFPPMPWDNSAPPATQHHVELFAHPTAMLDGKAVLYLPVLSDTKPTMVTINGTPAMEGGRSRTGGWYVVPPAPAGSAESAATYQVTYRFALSPEPRLPEVGQMEVDPAWPDDVKGLVNTLRAERNSLPAQEIARRIREFLVSPFFTYSLDAKDAAVLDEAEQAEGLAGRIRSFLVNRKGCCYESSYAFAYLSIAVGIHAISTNGVMTENGDIPKQSHRWDELVLPDGRRWNVDASAQKTDETPNSQTSPEDDVARPDNDIDDIISPKRRTILEVIRASREIWEPFDEHPKLSLDLLGLTYKNTERDKIHVKPGQGGRPDARRLALGHAKFMVKYAEQDSGALPKTLFLARPTGTPWMESVNNFFGLAVAFRALAAQGVRLVFEGGEIQVDERNAYLDEPPEGAWTQDNHKEKDLFAIFESWKINAGNTDWPTQEDISDHKTETFKVADVCFYGNLMHHYYASQLKMNESGLGVVDLDGDDEEAKCQEIALHWHLLTVGHSTLALPLELHFADKQLTITRTEFEKSYALFSHHTPATLLDQLFEFGKSDVEAKTNLEVGRRGVDAKNNSIVDELDKCIKHNKYPPGELERFLPGGTAIKTLILMLNPKTNSESLRSWALDTLKQLNEFGASRISTAVRQGDFNRRMIDIVNAAAEYFDDVNLGQVPLENAVVMSLKLIPPPEGPVPPANDEKEALEFKADLIEQLTETAKKFPHVNADMEVIRSRWLDRLWS